jgi:3D (Asp-Asp-Asp) domain-containing protein
MTALLLTLALAGTPLVSTSYCQTGTMADGSQTRARSVAENTFRLGTRLWVEPAVRGIHRWVVRDRIGWGSQIDFWTSSCAAARQWGRRTVRVTVGWAR